MNTGAIDAHAHLFPTPGYLDDLLAVYDRLGIERVCLSGLGDAFALADNDGVARAIAAAPDRVVGYYYVRLGQHDAADADRAVDAGFRGLKLTIPLHPYDDERFFPLYERAEALGLPCLFHTGIVTTAIYTPGVSSAKMRPVHLDAIAREFPRLDCVCAHMGMPWYEEAAAIARILPNVYLDVSGAPAGWRKQKAAAFFREALYWPGAWRKVLWGSDVAASDVAAALQRDRALVTELGLSESDSDAFFRDTALTLLAPA
ncbi:MAG: amidohydrolase family protein [Anaerolineae bacterium]